MIETRCRLPGCLAILLLVAAGVLPAHAEDHNFTLARVVPEDVFLFASGRQNPNREFVDQYWAEVFTALKDSGIGNDFMELVGSLIGEDGMAEAQRLKDRASKLLEGVNWDQLCGEEVAFAERLGTPIRAGDDVFMGPPDMAWIFRGSAGDAAHNYQGLVAILEAAVEEINKAAEAQALSVIKSSALGAEVASVDLLDMLPGAPAMPVAVSHRNELVIITVGESMLTDVLELLNGTSKKRPLAENARFRTAFGQLPPAEDEMTFFDMQGMLQPMRQLMDMAVTAMGSPNDAYHNTGGNAEANKLNRQALAAYRRGNIEEALSLTQKAYEHAPSDSIVLYNLACFHALQGHKDQALDWLGQAVDAGFYAPGKIAGDPDLDSLREDSRYAVALERASKLAAEGHAEDVVINSSKSGEAYKLCREAWRVYEKKDYEQGLRYCEQAYEVAPKDSRVLYYLACFHNLQGRQDRALEFLDKAVDGGFYCPDHIAKDPDLESLRDTRRYQAALDRARKNAVQMGSRSASEKLDLVKTLVDRTTDAVGILDYVANVSSTDGYDVRGETIAALVPLAERRAIYPVLSGRAQLSTFDRYLPKETLSFSVGNGLDLERLYGYVEDTLRGAGRKGNEWLETWNTIQADLGLDVRRDIFAWIDGQNTTVTLQDGKGSALLLKVKDQDQAREKVGAAIEFLSNKIIELAGKYPPLAMMSVRTSPVDSSDLPGFEYLHFTVSPQPLVWGVDDGHLIFGSSVEAVSLCLKTARGQHPGIRENQRIMAEALIPPGPFSSVSLTDRRNLGQELAAGVGMVSMLSGTAMMAAPDPKARMIISKISGMLAKLTPVVSKINFYKSAASYTTFDGKAWRTWDVTHYMSPAERPATARRKPDKAQATEGL